MARVVTIILDNTVASIMGSVMASTYSAVAGIVGHYLEKLRGYLESMARITYGIHVFIRAESPVLGAKPHGRYDLRQLAVQCKAATISSYTS